ncbi:hypothetical protein J6590_058122 [Homalodisca vitripennis]|nr:hypothetical protein J6590_058122 [Homalodisca vitripennis]
MVFLTGLLFPPPTLVATLLVSLAFDLDCVRSIISRPGLKFRAREERIRALLLEPISEGNEPLADDSDDGGDHEEDTSEHNTETEESADEDDEWPEPAREKNEMVVEEHQIQANATGELANSTNYILGKDGSTKLYLCKPPQDVRRPPHNILRMPLPGVRGPGKDCTEILECWMLFFTNDMLSDIVRYTNIKIQILRPHFARERDAKDTNITEMK